MPLFLQRVERGCRQPVDPEVINRDVAKNLEEPARELAVGIVRIQPLVDAQKTFLREVLRKRAVVHEPVGEVDGGRGVPRDELAVRRLGTGTSVPGQFSVASLHGHGLYGRSLMVVSGGSWLLVVVGRLRFVEVVTLSHEPPTTNHQPNQGLNNSLFGGATKHSALSVVSSGMGRPSI